MSEVFDSIMQGLKEAAAIARGEIPLELERMVEYEGTLIPIYRPVAQQEPERAPPKRKAVGSSPTGASNKS